MFTRKIWKCDRAFFIHSIQVSLTYFPLPGFRNHLSLCPHLALAVWDHFIHMYTFGCPHLALAFWHHFIHVYAFVCLVNHYYYIWSLHIRKKGREGEREREICLCIILSQMRSMQVMGSSSPLILNSFFMHFQTSMVSSLSPRNSIWKWSCFKALKDFAWLMWPAVSTV